MAIISIVAGWIVAGRVLRPLRTITAATRDISATSLHRRLALDGPDDELKELGDTIDELLARLDASFRSQRTFVANASHELRAPLARQRALGQVALADPDASVESLSAAHERVLAAGAQQERLIEALLTLARGEAGLERLAHSISPPSPSRCSPTEHPMRAAAASNSASSSRPLRRPAIRASSSDSSPTSSTTRFATTSPTVGSTLRPQAAPVRRSCP